jgi:hypothetical protein
MPHILPNILDETETHLLERLSKGDVYTPPGIIA